mmetsp:Transcript_1329/g.4089  ORF Transcript_1329/g.4089 Transcript_1329/m.4089 type:complete len:213 (+) Transcript_1329:345-983(+)
MFQPSLLALSDECGDLLRALEQLLARSCTHVALFAEICVKDRPGKSLRVKHQLVSPVNPDGKAALRQSKKFQDRAFLPFAATSDELIELAQSRFAGSCSAALHFANPAKQGAVKAVGNVVSTNIAKHDEAKDNARVASARFTCQLDERRAIFVVAEAAKRIIPLEHVATLGPLKLRRRNESVRRVALDLCRHVLGFNFAHSTGKELFGSLGH